MATSTHLKKGELLMKEGENSNSMYWVQAGTLRLFKKKGEGYIELGVVHSGEVLGEMSFLDNQPRSASVEALQPCDIVEIPRGKFEEIVAAQPSWMKALFSTLVKRLRSTSNRVRELESSSTVYAKDEDGRTTKVHEFLSTADQLKLSSALLLAAARNGEMGSDGNRRLKPGWLQYYASQILSVQLSKVQVFTDLMDANKILKIERKADQVDLVLLDLDRLEKYIYFAQDENSKIDEKQIPVTAKGMAVMDGIAEFGSLPNAGGSGETFTVNMDDVYKKMAAARNVKSPFEWSAFEELVKGGFSAEVRADSSGRSVVVQLARFQKLYPVMALRQKFRELNAQKRDNT